MARWPRWKNAADSSAGQPGLFLLQTGHELPGGKAAGAFAARKIRVNAVLPGSTDTGLKGDFLKLTGSEERLLAFTGHAHRLAASEEMAMPIVFQCSDMASYLSGDLMVVDYGSSLEVEAGIRPNAMAFTFDMILEKMAAMHK